MSNVGTVIDTLAERAKRLPVERQQAVADALREMLDEPYRLSAAELAVLQPALADAQAGMGLTDASDDNILNSSWS